MTIFSRRTNNSFLVMTPILLLLGFMIASFKITGVESVGACYGMLGNNLPPASEVVNLYKSYNLDRMRLYDPNRAAIQALQNSNIEVMIGVPNSDLQRLANDPGYAYDWVYGNLVDYPQVKFRYIAVGNEVSPINGGTAWLAPFVLPAMQHIQTAVLSAARLANTVKVSTAIDMTLIGNSYPPSQGSFRGDIRAYFDPIIRFLVNNNAPLLANVYPYFSHIGNPRDISLSYAIFTAPGPVIWDNGLGYQNLFDAMMDALYAAVERAGGGSLKVVVSETGWPSAGGVATTFDNARNYYSRLIQHVEKGTPRRPGRLETYMFATFDENNKNPEYEKHFGLFFPNKQPKFPLRISMGTGSGDIVSDGNSTSLGWVKSDM